MIKKIKNDKTLLILSIIIVVVAILLVSRIAYAFLTMRVNDVISKVHLNSDLVDELKFKIGNPLSLDITTNSLKEGEPAVMVSSTNQVTLKANESDNQASYTYYVYIDIPENTFEYTKNTDTPELLLKVTGPDGEVTSLSGLEYKTQNEISGFDITTHQGLIEVAANFPITSNSSMTNTIQEWTFNLYYLNLDHDQSANYGNHIKTRIGLTKNQAK